MVPTKPAGDEFIVLASLDSRRAAERVVASLGHKFRVAARKRHASALVLSANPDGSLKLTPSRAESASDLVAALIRISLSLMVGFMGLVTMLKGAQETGRAAKVRKGHVGSDETRGHEILAEAGPNAGVLLVRCSDEQMFEEVTATVGERATFHWHGTRREFLEGLDPGSQYDWVRTALDEPSA